MVVLVTKNRKFPQAEAAVELIKQLVPNVTSIMQNINGEKTNVIFGNETLKLWGNDTIEDTIGDVRFEISARSFYQVNPEQTEVLYKQALDYADLKGDETVIDAYCGIGSISLFLAQKAKYVMGVEIVPEAIEDAKRNAELNGFTNTYFEAGPAEEVIPRWYKEGKTADVLVVDPPRKGCDEALLNTILEQRPKRVVYVSCNPATLARDLRILEDGGYKTQEVQPVDMFPHTAHCEAVAWLELVK
jgi:23S rRNA (uracil1939-C5)-methyltransferase